MRHLLFVIIIVIPLCACHQAWSDEQGSEKKPGLLKALPNDTTRLWLSHGSAQSDSVLIVCQGGPSSYLTFAEEGRTSYRYLPGYNDYQVVYLHQAQTWDSLLLSNPEPFDLAKARAAVDQSAEMLYRSLHYFHTRNKKIKVIGSSYGAYLIQNYLSTRPSLAYRYAILAGRIDDSPQMLEQHKRGYNGRFAEDGLLYIPEDENQDLSQYSESEQRIYVRKQLLKAAIGEQAYSIALKDVNLSSCLYMYASNDQHVGQLNESELHFLKEKGVRVLVSHDGHSEVLYRFIDSLNMRASDSNISF